MLGKKLWAIVLTIILVASISSGCRKNGPAVSSTSSKSATKGITSAITSKVTAKTSQTGTQASTTKTTTTQGDNQQIEPGYTDIGDGKTGDNDNQDGDTVPVEEEYIFSKVLDLKGRTIKISTWADLQIPREGRSQIEDLTYRSFLRMEQKYNCKFEWEDRNCSGQQLSNDFISASLAGIPICDVLLSQTMWYYPNMTKSKLIMSIDDYVDFNDPFWGSWGLKSYWLGKHYGLPINNNGNQAFYGIWYNRELFEADGQADPQTLAKNKNWTWNSFLDIAITATKDTDGDGIINQWGVETSSTIYIIAGFMYSNGAPLIRIEGDNVVPNFNTPNALHALQFITEMKNVYKVITTGWKYSSGTVAMAVAPWHLWYNQYKNRGNQDTMYAPMPIGPDVTEICKYNQNFTQIVFPSYIDDPGSVVHVFADALSIWDQKKPEYTDPVIELNANLTLIPPGNDDIIMMQMNDVAVDFYMGFETFRLNLNSGLINPLWAGNSVSSVVDSFMPQAITYINDELK